MAKLIQCLATFWSWVTNAENSGGVTALAAVAGVLIALANKFVTREREVSAAVPSGGEVRLSVSDFQAVLEEREQEVANLLAEEFGHERIRLEKQLAEVRHQLSDVELAYADTVSKIREIKMSRARLDGDKGNNLAEFNTAMEEGDFQKADALLAEFEARADIAVVRAAEAAFQRGQVAVLQIRWDEAATHFDKAGRLNPTYDHLNEAGKYAQLTARYNNALRHFEKLLELSRHMYGERSTASSKAFNSLASVLRDTGRYEEAEPLLRQALEISRESPGENHLDHATHLNNLASTLRDIRRYGEAEPLFRQALEISRESLGADHLYYANGIGNLGKLLWKTGRYDEAEPLLRQALEIERKVLGEYHPDFAFTLDSLASLFKASGRYEEGKPLYRQAVEIFRAALGDAHPNTKRVAGNYARLLRAQFPDDPALGELRALFGEDVGRN